MLNESELHIGKFVDDKDAEKSGLARVYVEAARAWRKLYGDIPFPQASSATEKVAVEPTPDLEKDWQKQAKQLAHLFAKEVGQSKDEYMDKLPKFSPQPEQFKGRLDTFVIAETRVALPRMVKIVGIVPYYDIVKTKDWQKDTFRTPDRPYTTWLHDGSKNVEKSVETVRNNLAVDERGGTIYDGIGLYLKDSATLKHHSLDFPGSQVGADYAPFLFVWRVRPKLNDRWVGSEYTVFGSVVAGRDIKT